MLNNPGERMIKLAVLMQKSYICTAMKVVTLDNESLSAACVRLEEKSAEFMPDLVLGIASGGEEVARRMFLSLPHAVVRCRRPGSEKKDRSPFLFRLIRALPRTVRDWLRIAEARWLSARGGRPDSRRVECSAEDRKAIAGASRILVVDDAVDSGATLAAVVEMLGADGCNKKEVASAVLTVTTANPAARPDYTLYDNRTLLRFPWSKDYNPED